MANSASTPFSARTRGKHNQIDRDFPSTARIGLLHIVRDLVAKDYIRDWSEVIKELERIARMLPSGNYNLTESNSFAVADELLSGLSWEKVYDFCERLHNHLARDKGYHDQDGDFVIMTPRSDVQQLIDSELQRLFSEEGLAFDFRDGLVQRRGRKHTVERVSKAEVVMGDAKLLAARKHYDKALQFFRAPAKPDYENTVKEAVCAVEAAGKALFPQAKATTLGDLVKWLINNEETQLSKGLSQTLTGLYAFRSSGTGVGHGGAVGGAVNAELAEYVLGVAASQIILLVDLANALEYEPPF